MEALGVLFERVSSLDEALATQNRDEGDTAALILSEEQLIAARALAVERSLSLAELFAPYAQVLIYPCEGRVEAMEALSEWIGGQVEMWRHEGGEKKYSVRRLAIAGPFTGLEFGPTHPASDFGVKISGSAHPVETIVGIDHLEFFTRIDLPTTQLFVCCSSAVFDVGAEARRNLNAAARFSSLVPLIFFLRHCQAASWRTPIGMASIVIDDPDLKPSYGFLKASTLARCVDELGCAVSIAFIPWNFKRTSPTVVESFRSRWPWLSLCVHGSDHVKDEFCAEEVVISQQLIAQALDRMRQLGQRTGLKYDRVMVFPRGEFSTSAMQALRKSPLLAAVNTELLDNRNGRGVKAGQLLQPAITAYSGFPLFLRRSETEPLVNFALDLLLGKPCLVGIHHDFFRNGSKSFVSLINSLNALDSNLTWTNLESIVSQTYSARTISDRVTEIRLFSSLTSLPAQRSWDEAHFSKYEPLADDSFRVSVDSRNMSWDRQGSEVAFSADFASPTTIEVKTEMSSVTEPPLPAYRLPYRMRVATRRCLSRIRDNHDAGPAWARAIWRLARKFQASEPPPGEGLS
ncbi:MAG: hypothetical protein H0T83_06425 [Chthoniobacterales bacterium]|nr:hypothetical protein [Chthoniobacterales bacterium]